MTGIGLQIILSMCAALQAFTSSDSVLAVNDLPEHDKAVQAHQDHLEMLISSSYLVDAEGFADATVEASIIPKPRSLLQAAPQVTGNASIKPLLASLPYIARDDATLVYPRDLNARCQIQIVGNNATANGITSASIRCSTADNTAVYMYVGSALLRFASNFSGVYAVAPPANSGIQLDQYCIYLRQTGSIHIYNSTVDNLAISSGTSFLTIDQGTSPVLISDSQFTGITTCTGQPSSICWAALSIFNSTTYVQLYRTTFRNLKCLNPTLCFSGAIVVTNGASLRLLNSNISQAQGHYGGALVVTQASNIKISNSTLQQNTALYGSFGGALWINSCSNSLDGKTVGYAVINETYFQGNLAFEGGAVWVSDCPNVVLRQNTFDSNTAVYDGGGAALLRSSKALISQNLFLNNHAGTFGGSVSLQPCIAPASSGINSFLGNGQSIASNSLSQGCGLAEVYGLNSTLLTEDQEAAYNAFFASIQAQTFPVVV